MLPPVKYREILWGEGPENTEDIPKIIWSFWDYPKESPLVNACFRNLKKYLPGFEVHILNRENVKKFLPEAEIQIREDISFVNFTDLVRLNVLDVYGGFWLDASIMLTENFDWIFNLKSEYNADLIGFYSDLVTNDFEYPVLETWFLASPKNGKMIHDWHMEFRKCYYSPDPHNFYSEIKNNPALRQNITEDWLLDYLIAYQAAMTVMRRSKNYRILMISANDMAHFYNFNLKIKGKDLSRLFLQGTVPEHYPKLIKFEKNGRNIMDADIAYGKYRRKSFLFSISEEPDYYLNKLKRRKDYAFFIIRHQINLLFQKINTTKQ